LKAKFKRKRKKENWFLFPYSLLGPRLPISFFPGLPWNVLEWFVKNMGILIAGRE
jgi:hypothetical protein